MHVFLLFILMNIELLQTDRVIRGRPLTGWISADPPHLTIINMKKLVEGPKSFRLFTNPALLNFTSKRL